MKLPLFIYKNDNDCDITYNMFWWNVEEFLFMKILLLDIDCHKVLRDGIVLVFIIIKALVTVLLSCVKMI